MNKNKLLLFQQWSLILLFFSLPFYKRIVPVFIIIFVFSWLINGDFKEKYHQIKQNRWALLLPVFFLLHLVGMIFTNNIKVGWQDIEMRVSLIIFPIIFVSNSNLVTFKSVILFFKAFIAGSFFSGCIALLIAFFRFLNHESISDNETGYFFYQNLSYFMHVSYFSLYLCLAIGICYFFYYQKIINQIFSIFLILFFSGLIFLLASKGGIICFITTLVCILLHFIFNSKNKWKAMFVMVATVMVLFFLLNENPRFKSLKTIANDLIHPKVEDLKLSSNDSNAERSFLIKAGIEVIKENFWVGVGTGDVKDEEVKKYKEMKFTKLADQQLNSHNQYIDTTIQLGIIGGCFYFFILATSLFYFIKKSNLIGIIFIISWMVGCLFEAMFNQQAGIIYFCLFYSFLIVIPFKLSDNLSVNQI